MSELAIGQVIQLADGRNGTIRYIGQPNGIPTGGWLGIELEDFSGKNDGSINGESYFECEMGKGMFVRPTAVAIIEQPPPRPKAANGPALAKKNVRPSSVISSGTGRRISAVPDVGAGKRASMNAASPSPATRRPSSMLRVGFRLCPCY